MYYTFSIREIQKSRNYLGPLLPHHSLGRCFQCGLGFLSLSHWIWGLLKNENKSMVWETGQWLEPPWRKAVGLSYRHSLSMSCMQHPPDRLLKRPLTVLVHQHPRRNAVHIKPVQKILKILVGNWVNCTGVFILKDPLSHRRDHIVMSVSNFDECVYKAKPEHLWLVDINEVSHVSLP